MMAVNPDYVGIRVRAGEPFHKKRAISARFYLSLCSIFTYFNQKPVVDTTSDKQIILIVALLNITILYAQAPKQQSDLEALGNWCIPKGMKPAQKRLSVNVKLKHGKAGNVIATQAGYIPNHRFRYVPASQVLQIAAWARQASIDKRQLLNTNGGDGIRCCSAEDQKLDWPKNDQDQLPSSTP
jgi:hypothetical protein